VFTQSRDWPRQGSLVTNQSHSDSNRLTMTDIQTLLSLHSGTEVRPFSTWISSLIVHRTSLNRKPSRHSFCRRLVTRIPVSHWTKFTLSFANPALSPIWYARARLFRSIYDQAVVVGSLEHLTLSVTMSSTGCKKSHLAHRRVW
jgi:hypothetical protein